MILTATMLVVALKYMELGVPLFPLWPLMADGTCACRGRFGNCAGPGKHPATRWVHGPPEELPSTDPVRARAWWGEGVDRFGIPRSVYGIGMPTGETSGIFVIDLDNKPTANGMATLARLTDEHGALPDGPVVATPSGGQHLYFKAPAGGGPTTAGVARPGIDTRGRGGMVVMAPSMHKSGKQYRWQKRLSLFLPDKLPEVPQWFLALANPRPTALPSTPDSPRRSWAVPKGEAAATLMEVLDGAYARWMVEWPEEVSREAWRAFATNLHAACAGHRELLDLAHAAWHQMSACDGARYLYGHAERVWTDAASSPPISFEHVSLHGAPDEVCASPHKNLVLEARSAAMSAGRADAYVAAALHYLAENPGALRAEAAAKGMTTRDLLIDEGYLDDTAGTARRGAASPA